MCRLFYWLRGIRRVQGAPRMPITLFIYIVFAILLHHNRFPCMTGIFSGQHLFWHSSAYTHQFLPQHTLTRSNIGFEADYSYMSVHIQSSGLVALYG